MIFYELAYGWNFISIELLFRGFLVIGMVKLMGRHAILPMIVVYSFIHFGKPAGECISAIFGGYILGIIAYFMGIKLETWLMLNIGFELVENTICGRSFINENLSTLVS